jgi:hypothetical protein
MSVFMTSTSSIATLTSPKLSQGEDVRQQLGDRASSLNLQARLAAERGDFEESARLILAALDCERRAGGLGPQVLQLIKPRA